jgi:hypothetical protein
MNSGGETYWKAPLGGPKIYGKIILIWISGKYVVRTGGGESESSSSAARVITSVPLCSFFDPVHHHWLK